MSSSRNVPFGRPWITDDDRAAVMGVLDGPILTHGPECEAFEREFGEFMGEADTCVTVSSCMAALHLAYLHFGIGEGDEVVVAAQTHTATAHAVEMVGAKPVFVDCDPATGNVTAESIAAAVSPRTKAISMVHFVGIPCEMPSIMEIANANDLRVIEDCALAVGARVDGVHVGLFGDAGCYSFYPVKHLTTAEGGMFVSRHGSVLDGVRKLRGFGVDRTHTERKLPGLYDVPTLGLNYRMSELQAALGRAQLARVEENLARRASNFGVLKGALSDIPQVRVLDAGSATMKNSHYCLVMVMEGGLGAKRDDVLVRFKELGVGTSVYYPHPVPRLAYYREKYGYSESEFENAAEISDRAIALPVGPHLEPEDLEYIIQHVTSTLLEALDS